MVVVHTRETSDRSARAIRKFPPCRARGVAKELIYYIGVKFMFAFMKTSEVCLFLRYAEHVHLSFWYDTSGELCGPNVYLVSSRGCIVFLWYRFNVVLRNVVYAREVEKGTRQFCCSARSSKWVCISFLNLNCLFNLWWWDFNDPMEFYYFLLSVFYTLNFLWFQSTFFFL